jgi:tetratricopeptide (TPR) repeat protein
MYAIAALATSFRTFVTRDEVLIAIGGATNDALNQIEGLVRQKLLLDDKGGLTVRHRVIADRALNYFEREGQLPEAIRGLLFAMSTKAHWEAPKNSREQRLLIRLLSHEWLLRTIGRDRAREAYVEVESSLSWDYHYWLHRGALEVEAGDLSLAQNFLDQAKGLAPDDYKVQTEWAYMQLKRAARDAPSLESEERALDAIAELEDAVSGRGAGDSYPYHVLGSQGMSWVRRASLLPERRATILRRLLDAVKEGVKFHPRTQELRQLQEDLEREYLMTAVNPRPRDA